MPPRTPAFKAFIVLFGNENFFLDRDVERVRKGPREVFALDAADGLKDTELVALCEQRQTGDPCTVIVDNAHKIKGDKALSKYIEDRDLDDTSLVLVAVLRTAKLPSVWSAAVSKGKGVERKAIKPWETEKYLTFLKDEAKRLGVSLGKDVASTLHEYVGNDLYRLAAEMKKLAIFVGKAHTIQRDHIHLVTTASPQADPYKVAEAALDKNKNKALFMFSVLCSNMGDSACVPVTSALMRQIEKTAMIRSLQDQGSSEEDIAVLLDMKLWPYKNIAAPVARKHDLKSLVRHMGNLCKLDTDVKGPSKSKRALVEMAILNIAQ